MPKVLEEAVQSVLASRGTIKIAGHVVPCANVPPSMASEAGHLMCQEVPQGTESVVLIDDGIARPPFSATYHDDLAVGRRQFTLHSPEGGADVGEIARKQSEIFNAIAASTYVAKWRQGHEHWTDRNSGPWTASGSARSATFDAPLGWQGE